MITRFEGADAENSVMEIHQKSSAVTFYIYYPGEESVGSRISLKKSEISRMIDHLQNILDVLHEE